MNADATSLPLKVGGWAICIKDHPLRTSPIHGFDYIPRGHLTKVYRLSGDTLFEGEFFEWHFWLSIDHFHAAMTPANAP